MAVRAVPALAGLKIKKYFGLLAPADSALAAIDLIVITVFEQGCVSAARSKVRRQVIAQVARRTSAPVIGRLAEFCDFTQQRVDLLLLADDDLVKLLQQVFGKCRLDLQVNEALLNVIGSRRGVVRVVQVFHDAIGPESARLVRADRWIAALAR